VKKHRFKVAGVFCDAQDCDARSSLSNVGTVTGLHECPSRSSGSQSC
jgi:hypothetical protein